MRELVYADESGIHSGAQYCWIAGYRASPRRWRKFDIAWRTILRQFRIDEFHAKAFFHRKSSGKTHPFRNWSEQKAKAFLDSLLSAIVAHHLHPVACSVDVASFEALSYGERCYLTGGELRANSRSIRGGAANSPYFLALGLVLEVVATGTKPESSLDFIFDDQRRYKRFATETFYEIKQLREGWMGKQLRDISFEDSKCWPGLQAADLLANRWNNYSIRGRRINAENIKVMNILTRNGNDAMVNVNADGLERMLRTGIPDKDVREWLQAIPDPAGAVV